MSPKRNVLRADTGADRMPLSVLLGLTRTTLEVACAPRSGLPLTLHILKTRRSSRPLTSITYCRFDRHSLPSYISYIPLLLHHKTGGRDSEILSFKKYLPMDPSTPPPNFFDKRPLVNYPATIYGVCITLMVCLPPCGNSIRSPLTNP